MGEQKQKFLPKELLNSFASSLGGQSALAKRLSNLLSHPFSRGHVNMWTSGNRRIPPWVCIPVEVLSCGKIKAHQLRPDVFYPSFVTYKNEMVFKNKPMDEETMKKEFAKCLKDAKFGAE